MARLPRGWSPNGHDDIGPWTGEDVGGGLQELGWQLREVPGEEDFAEYRSGARDAVVHIDWTLKDIWAGDPVLDTWARNMVPSDLAGRTRRRAIDDTRKALLNAVGRYRRRKKGYA